MKNSSVSSISGKIKYKFVFLGDQNVGKTAIIQRFINNNFVDGNNPTVGIDFLAKNLEVNGKNYRLQLWDTAGQQRFKSLIPSYLKNAVFALIVYDVSSRASFNSITGWLQMFQQNKNGNSTCAIVGNKIDLKAKNVSIQQVQKLAGQYGIKHYLVSAKSGQNVQNLFYDIISSITGISSNINFNQSKIKTQKIKSIEEVPEQVKQSPRKSPKIKLKAPKETGEQQSPKNKCFC